MLALPDTANLPALTCDRPERNGADGSFNQAQSPALVRTLISHIADIGISIPQQKRRDKPNSAAVFLIPWSGFGARKRQQKMSDQEALRQELAELELEHRDLDDVIARLTERAPYDQLQLQRLKKRKLILKDQIAQVEAELYPDIIA